MISFKFLEYPACIHVDPWHALEYRLLIRQIRFVQGHDAHVREGVILPQLFAFQDLTGYVLS